MTVQFPPSSKISFYTGPNGEVTRIKVKPSEKRNLDTTKPALSSQIKLDSNLHRAFHEAKNAVRNTLGFSK